MKRAAEWMAVAALGAVLLWAMRGRAAGFPYGYDEADYLLSVEQGFAAHWWDSPSLTLAEFVRLGRSGEARRELSDRVRDGGYVDFYRHWHGPLYFYWLVGGGGAGTEQAARWRQMSFQAAGYLVVYGGVRALAGPAAALAAAVGFLISYTNVQTSVQLVPHALFTLCYMVSLLLAGWWMTGDQRRTWAWYGAVAAAGLAFATLEVALVLVATLAICAWIERKRIGAAWKGFAARSAAVFVGTVLAVWPAGLLKLSFVKAYAFMAYLALFRKAAWGGESVWGSWWARLEASPVEWALFAAGVALTALYWRESKAAVPLAIYGVLMIVAVGKVAADERLFLVPRYQAPYVAALLAAGVMVVTRRVEVLKFKWVSAILLILLLGWNSWRQFELHPVPEYFPWQQVVAGLTNRGLEGKTVLVPPGIMPVMRYYLRGVNWRPYEEAETATTQASKVGAAGVVGMGQAAETGGTPVTLSTAYSGERIVFVDLRRGTR